MLSRLLTVPGTVLVDDLDIVNHNGITYLFSEPLSVISAESSVEVDSALESIDEQLAEGRYLAGYISYDAGLMLDAPIESTHQPSVPMIWLGVYDSVQELGYGQSQISQYGSREDIQDISLNVSDDDYVRSVERIREYIAAGDVYQVNYTCKIFFENLGTAVDLFARLRLSHPVCHSAFINTGEFQVVSLSPELFLRKTGRTIISKPMKGTSPRGRFLDEDTDLSRRLQQDLKTRAENLMIVDLMRNDLGKISRYGGVSVPGLFDVERYRTLLQMTSEVHGTVREDAKVSHVLRATFPPGSITGAPKIRATQIIDELEAESRGVYCGSIGFFRPDGDFLLNVAIRTIIQREHSCELGVGSGIVADSDPQAELRETLLKSEFIKATPPEFKLLETMLYKRGEGYSCLNEHLNRMKRSAFYFGWRFDADLINKTLDRTAQELQSSSSSRYRVRLLLSHESDVDIQWTEIDSSRQPSTKLILSRRVIDAGTVFLYHKTTSRDRYDRDFRECREAGYLEVLYFNNRGELTECATTNVMLEIDGRWYTPPITCGLLPGIWRDRFIKENDVIERVLTLNDLLTAQRVVIGNSVRGDIRVSQINDAEGCVMWKTVR